MKKNKACFFLLYFSFTIIITPFSIAQVINPSQGAAIASRYPIVCNKPAPRFFEGALLGNGGLGVNVTTRPDAIVLYFGHNNVWDIRIAENHREAIGTFEEVFNKVKNIPTSSSSLNQDPWYKQYLNIAGDNYNKPWPRPFPCGSVILGFDKRTVELTGHQLDISNGVCSVRLIHQNKNLVLKIFTDQQSDQVLLQLVDEKDQPATNIFTRIKIIPDPSTPNDIPKYHSEEKLQEGLLSFRQVLPFTAPGNSTIGKAHPKDRAFRLTAILNGNLTKSSNINWHGSVGQMADLEAALPLQAPFIASIVLEEGLATAVADAVPKYNPIDQTHFNNTFASTQKIWNTYWSKSSVKLSDTFLEEIWYRNLYFFNCATKDGVNCPGLFANWSYDKIGTAWHGDYHMNYNTQQPFWVSFSSNHLEKNLPYVNLIHHLLPVSRKWAEEYYKLPGAYFPHSAYPVEMNMNPYPLPDWGWEVCETPWAVQGLWWHYLYSGDKQFLKHKVYEPLKAACEFLTAYMKRPAAHGGERWKDDKFHIFPTVPPELFALQPGFRLNYDCNADLSLTKFVFNAFKKATQDLEISVEENKLLSAIDEILNHFPAYPTAVAANNKEVFVSVPGESSNTIYNVPLPLFSVFPGEEYGLHSDSITKKLLKNTYQNQQNEGGNDLVFINMQAARAGLLNIEKFKRQIQYCLLPNGTATNLVTQVNGRYNDLTDYSYMGGMGIWFENFALPAVINECLMQSYNGTIRLFPNWPAKNNAAFHDLRAAGAFLVSAEQTNGKISHVLIKSEKGNLLRLMAPWGKKGFIIQAGRKTPISRDLIEVETQPGELIRMIP